MRGLRGLDVKLATSPSSPRTASASGKFVLNQATMTAGSVNLSSSSAGAKTVQVNDRSCARGNKLLWHLDARMNHTYFVGESNQHERVTGPNVKVARIEQVNGVSMLVLAGRKGKLDVFMSNIFLLKVHPGQLVNTSCCH